MEKSKQRGLTILLCYFGLTTLGQEHMNRGNRNSLPFFISTAHHGGKSEEHGGRQHFVKVILTPQSTMFNYYKVQRVLLYLDQ